MIHSCNVQFFEGVTELINHVQNRKSPLTNTADGTVRCQLTYKNLWYGKYEQDKEPELKMKLVIGFVDQMLEKDVVKVNEAETEIFKQPSKKYGFVSQLGEN